MLIDQQEMEMNPTAEPIEQSPVVGLMNDHVPTSGNVHLYADPRTKFTKKPILYADCEGLQGGEIAPGASSYRSDSPKKNSIPSALRETLGKVKAMSRDIAWADTPEKRKREFAVTELYPRLLYTFSDVIVFVLRNVR